MQTDGRPTRRLLLPAFLSSAATPLAKFRMNPQKALYWSLTNLDIGGIMELLSMPAIDIDERDTARGLQTVLMRLCHLHISDDDRDTILRLIISREPDVNVQDSSGRTALAHACIAERTDDVIECLARIPQCDPNVRDNDGNTPLLYAVKSRKVKVVQAMLSCFSGKGLKVDAVNNKGLCALAESRFDNDIYRILIKEGGANPALLGLASHTDWTYSHRTPSIEHWVQPSPRASSRERHSSRPKFDSRPPTVDGHSWKARESPSPCSVATPGRQPVGTPGRQSLGTQTKQGCSLIANDISDLQSSSTVLVSVRAGTLDHVRMPSKAARMTDNADDFNVEYSTRGRRMKNAHALPNLRDSSSQLVELAASKNKRNTEPNLHEPTCAEVMTSEGKLPLVLPKLVEEDESKTKGVARKEIRHRRKGSGSLPNLNNSNHLVSAQSTQAAPTSGSNESRTLDWERGLPTQYRKVSDFKLPQLNVESVSGSLTTRDWCPGCSSIKGYCGCVDGGTGSDDCRRPSKSKTRPARNMGKVLYLTGERVNQKVRPSRTFKSNE